MPAGVPTFIEAAKRFFSGVANQASASTQLGFGTTTTLSTASALTLTAAQVTGGLILRNPNGAGRTDTLPTAALMVAYFTKSGFRPLIGQRFEFTIRNTAGAAETITVAAGTGGTISGTATIAQSNSKSFIFEFTGVNAGSEAYTCYSLGTVVT